MSETLAFVDAVNPKSVIPIHNALLSERGHAMYLGHVDAFSPDDTEVIDLRRGSTYDT